MNNEQAKKIIEDNPHVKKILENKDIAIQLIEKIQQDPDTGNFAREELNEVINDKL